MRLTVPALLLCLVLLMAACSTTATTTTSATPPASTTTVSDANTAVPAPTVPATTSPPTTTSPNTTVSAGIEIVFADGSVAGPDRIEVTLGEMAEFTVVSDTADEVHVHGYDLYADVAPGTAGSFSFVADIPGIFEVEMEGSHTVLVELIVQ